MDVKQKSKYAYERAYLDCDHVDYNEADDFCHSYKGYLNCAKTEREAVQEVIEHGCTDFKQYDFEANVNFSPGDKYYFVNNDKSIVMFIIGYEPINTGMKLIAAHIDSPRLDLKPVPMFETNDLVYFKTHYYGGIKKYQWATIPLALHGVMWSNDGKKLSICIGEDDEDPVLYISDLLPHLAQDQMDKIGNEIINGEQLNVLIGSRKGTDDSVDGEPYVQMPVKDSLLERLYEKYGIIEKSFLTAELEIVPAIKAREAGLDKSMIAAYGQDDRSCAFCAINALLDISFTPKKTLVCVLTDKEEIGSFGNTGLQSNYLKYLLEHIVSNLGGDFTKCMLNSECLSADVNAAYDPTFSDVFESNNATYLNGGIVINKYTGSGGKSGASDANAEYLHRLTEMFDRSGITWQIGELGKVDVGGGGTVAKLLANLGMNVIDAGVPVLSMHSPYELTAKNDVYMTYLAYSAFYKN